MVEDMHRVMSFHEPLSPIDKKPLGAHNLLPEKSEASVLYLMSPFSDEAEKRCMMT